ncbi:MAG TPA: hypothetical protein VJ992_13270 [Gemmatimonadales bacterium]|nr:hypothetical protein [Gemmatimonadales bacterium]
MRVKLRRLLQILGVVLAVLVIAGAATMYATNRTHDTPLLVVNQSGRATALVVYQPGLSAFQQEMTDAFLDGLVDVGWRVEVTTVGDRGPQYVAPYGLVVFGGPVYWSSPARPLRRYIAQVKGLHDMPTAIVLTGLGSVKGAKAEAEHLVRAAGGAIVASLALTIMRPNDEEAMRAGERNRVTAARLAREAGRQITPPAR